MFDVFVADIRRLIMHGLDDEKLANFCRVLSVTISDLDIYENKSSRELFPSFTQNMKKDETFKPDYVNFHITIHIKFLFSSICSICAK